jgi:glycosyltransferase involved in cell wall biosynthesis
VLPRYRAPFFDLLGEHCAGGLAVFAGKPRPSEGIATADQLEKAELTQARNQHLFWGGAYVCIQRGLLPWLARANPDALILEANPRYLSSRRAIEWMRARGRPVIGWGLGAPPLQGPLAGLRQSRRQRFLAGMDALIAYSEAGADQYRALGIPAERVFVAPNAVAEAPQGKAPKRPPSFIGAPTLLFVGRLQVRKGLDRLLRACAALPAGSQPRLLVVGDGPERASLEVMAASVYPQAKFLGSRFGSELDAVYHEADLFVLPGTGGLAIQQAMAQGLPIIAAEGDGTQADLVSEGNGWLVAPGDVAALTAALAEALSDPARLRRMGAKSFQLVKERYNLGSMLEVFLSVFKQVAD